MSKTDQFFTDQHLNENGIALYVDALMLERMESLPEELRRHVEQCDECKHHIMQVSGLLRGQSPDIPKQHPYFDRPASTVKNATPWLRAAAAVVIILAGGALFLLLQNPKTTEPSGTTHIQSPEQHPPQETAAQQGKEPNTLLADNFTPSPNLDDLIVSDFRSEAAEAVTPSNGETVRPPITFRWITAARQVKLKILSNKEIPLMTAIVAADSFIVTKKFDPGLYYWKLEEEDELLFIGKFFIR